MDAFPSYNTPYEKIGNEVVPLDVPFDIPDSWEWVRLSDIGETNIGLTYKPSDVSLSGVPVLRSNNIQNGEMDYSDLVYVTSDVPERAYAQKGDILICARNGSRALVGKSAIIDKDGMAFGAFMAIFRSICNPYIQLFINSYVFRGQLEGATTTTINQITQDMLKRQLCPLPPLAEQARIVAKYNELAPVLVEYAKAYSANDMLEKAFPEQLKKSILQWAVQGKLVPQDENDEPAEVLLERIRTEKEALIKAGKIKRDKHESVIFRRDNSHYEKRGSEVVCIDDELPFEIPASWRWVRAQTISTKEIKRGKSPQYTENSTVCVFAQKCNVKAGGINMRLAKFLDVSAFCRYPMEEQLIDGDIIVNSTGEGTLGRIGIFRDSDRLNDYPIVPDSHVAIIRTSREFAENYIYYVFRYYQAYLESLGEGSTKQTELKPAVLAELFVPIPPLEEQHRIVESLDKILSVSEQL